MSAPGCDCGGRDAIKKESPGETSPRQSQYFKVNNLFLLLLHESERLFRILILQFLSFTDGQMLADKPRRSQHNFSSKPKKRARLFASHRGRHPPSYLPARVSVDVTEFGESSGEATNALAALAIEAPLPVNNRSACNRAVQKRSGLRTTLSHLVLRPNKDIGCK